VGNAPSLRGLLAAVASVALAASLTGCSESTPGRPTGGLAIVLGAHGNMPPAGLDGVAAQVLDNAVESQALVSIVVADGAPHPLGTSQLRTTGEDDDARQASEAANRRELDEDIASAAARTPETDLLSALGLAAREIAAAPGRHTILVIDSGLSTSGAVDFRQAGLLDAAADDLVASLRAASTLPDLSGTHVVYQGLGDIAAPQGELGLAARTQLVDLWTAVALAGGAIDVNVERTRLHGDPATELPAVSVVGAGDGLTCTENTVVLDGGDVAFQADTAVFRDPAVATTTLQPVAERMKLPGVTGTLTGTTADVGDDDGQRRLSRERAQTVADLLQTLGVPAGTMTVIGLGSDFPGYVDDHDSQGGLLPGPAALNRKVIIELTGTGTTVVCG